MLRAQRRTRSETQATKTSRGPSVRDEADLEERKDGYPSQEGLVRAQALARKMAIISSAQVVNCKLFCLPRTTGWSTGGRGSISSPM